MRHDPCPRPAVRVVRHDQRSSASAICTDDEDVWHKSCPSASGPWCDWWPTGAAIVSIQLSCIIQTDRSSSGAADVTVAFLSNKDCVYEWILLYLLVSWWFCLGIHLIYSQEKLWTNNKSKLHTHNRTQTDVLNVLGSSPDTDGGILSSVYFFLYRSDRLSRDMKWWIDHGFTIVWGSWVRFPPVAKIISVRGGSRELWSRTNP